MNNRKLVAVLLSGIALASVLPASALDLGVDVGGVAGAGVSLDEGGLDVGADVADTVDVEASAGPSGIDAGGSVGDVVGGDVSAGQGGIDAGVEAGGGTVDAGVTAGPQGIGVDLGAAPPQAVQTPQSPVPVGSVAAPGQAQPVQTLPGGVSVQPVAAAPLAPPVSRTKTTAGVPKLTATEQDERTDAILDLLEDSGLAGVDLDEVIDDRRIVIVWLDSLLDAVARERIYTAIRRGASGYGEVTSAISTSYEVAEVLRRNGIDTHDVVAIQIGLDGTTEILVSERSRIVMAGEDIPLVWDMFANAYFPVGQKDTPLWQTAYWNPDALVSPALSLFRTRFAMPAPAMLQAYAAPSAPPRIPEARAVSQAWQGCSATETTAGADIDYLSSRAWNEQTVGTETVIPGWDMNGVALHALMDDDTERLDAVMAVAGKPVDDLLTPATGSSLGTLDRFSQVFPPESAQWADMVMATHSSVQQVDLHQVAFTEQVAADFAPRSASVTLTALSEAPASPCDPQTFDTLRSIGLDVVASLD